MTSLLKRLLPCRPIKRKKKNKSRKSVTSCDQVVISTDSPAVAFQEQSIGEVHTSIDLRRTVDDITLEITSSPAKGLLAKVQPNLGRIGPSESGVQSPHLLRNNISKNASVALAASAKLKMKGLVTESTLAHSKLVRSRRLMKEFEEINRRQLGNNATFSAELVDDNLYEWHIKLYKVDPDSELRRDMQELNIPFILLNCIFPDNFPFAPPFLRVISPRVEKGFVMEGGAICMELLTPRGWASAYTVEAIVMQLCASLSKGQARIGRDSNRGFTSKTHRLTEKKLKEFNRKSAEASFKSLVKTHDKYGWVTPPMADG